MITFSLLLSKRLCCAYRVDTDNWSLAGYSVDYLTSCHFQSFISKQRNSILISLWTQASKHQPPPTLHTEFWVPTYLGTLFVDVVDCTALWLHCTVPAHRFLHFILISLVRLVFVKENLTRLCCACRLLWCFVQNRCKNQRNFIRPLWNVTKTNEIASKL